MCNHLTQLATYVAVFLLASVLYMLHMKMHDKSIFASNTTTRHLNQIEITPEINQ